MSELGRAVTRMLMARWVTSPKPSSELTAEPEATETRADGVQVFYYHTANGVRFAELVEPSGFVLWLQQRD